MSAARLREYGLRGAVALVGAAESALGKTPDRTVLSLQQEAALAAVTDAGLTMADVDGLFVSGYPYAERPAVLAAEYLGLRPTYLESTNLGGSGFVAAVERAGAAIAAGVCETVLITYGSTQYSSRTRSLSGRPPEWSYQFEVPHGPALPLSGYALAATRHMHLFGTRLATHLVTASRPRLLSGDRRRRRGRRHERGTCEDAAEEAGVPARQRHRDDA
jgi:acetyl-CoA acetyltransferase